MITIEINWIKNSVRVEDINKNQYGVVSLNNFEYVDEAALRAQIMNMYDNDEINMRDAETGEEVV